MNSSSQVLVERLNKVCSEYVREVVMECGKLYSFEGSEALSRLGLSEIPLLENPLLEKVEQKVVEKVVEKVVVEKKVSSVVEKKGRPKKSKKELEVQGEDLFAELIFSAQNPVLDVVAEVLVPLPLLEKVEEKKVEVEEKKVEKKVVVSKGEKEALKAAKEAEKLAKEAEKLSLKEKKEAEKMSKKGEKKAVKKVEQKKVEVSSSSSSSSEILAPPFPKVEEILAPLPLLEKVEQKKVEEILAPLPLLEKVEQKVEEEEEADVVKKFEYEGVKYLKSKKTGIIYNMEQEVVGKWNEESKKIDFEEEDDSSDEEE